MLTLLPPLPCSPLDASDGYLLWFAGLLDSVPKMWRFLFQSGCAVSCAERQRCCLSLVLNRDCLKVILCLLMLLKIIEFFSVWCVFSVPPLTEWILSLAIMKTKWWFFFFLTYQHISLCVNSINATALCRVRDKWCKAILELSRLIVKCLLIILWCRAQRTHLFGSIPHFPGEIEGKMSHIKTFFLLLPHYFYSDGSINLPFSLRTVLPTVSKMRVGCPALAVNQLNPLATQRPILPFPLQSPLFQQPFIPPAHPVLFPRRHLPRQWQK